MVGSGESACISCGILNDGIMLVVLEAEMQAKLCEEPADVSGEAEKIFLFQLTRETCLSLMSSSRRNGLLIQLKYRSPDVEFTLAVQHSQASKRHKVSN